MHGARAAAWDFIKPHLKAGISVLDVCCGRDPWLRPLAKKAGCEWIGIDQAAPDDGGDILKADLGGSNVWVQYRSFDLAVSVYGLQHLCGREAIGWEYVRKSLKPEGRFIYVGNHSEGPQCFRNEQRNDHGNVYMLESFRGLVLATGFDFEQFRAFEYKADPSSEFMWETGECNGFAVILKLRP